MEENMLDIEVAKNIFSPHCLSFQICKPSMIHVEKAKMKVKYTLATNKEKTSCRGICVFNIFYKIMHFKSSRKNI